jgi:hypothetical protein
MRGKRQGAARVSTPRPAAASAVFADGDAIFPSWVRRRDTLQIFTLLDSSMPHSIFAFRSFSSHTARHHAGIRQFHIACPFFQSSLPQSLRRQQVTHGYA